MTEIEELKSRVEALELQVEQLERYQAPYLFIPNQPLGPLPYNEDFEKEHLRLFLEQLAEPGTKIRANRSKAILEKISEKIRDETGGTVPVSRVINQGD